jgi:hypothetical protein
MFQFSCQEFSLIWVQYTEEPVPWERAIFYTYNASRSHKVSRVCYNSSYYFRHSDMNEFMLMASNYIMLLFINSSKAITKVKLYDMFAGKCVGHLVIPPKEKRPCMSFRPCMDTIDMATFTFTYAELSKLSITFYNSIQHNIKDKLVYTLIHNRTIIVHVEAV